MPNWRCGTGSRSRRTACAWRRTGPSPTGTIDSPTMTKSCSCRRFPEADMFAISEVPIDVVRLQHGLDADGAGAVVCFQGRVRNYSEGSAVIGLSYQAYVEWAEA